MTGTRTTQHVKATPDAVYAAFMDPAILVQWLPPADMTGVINDFAARVGGGHRMTLTYAAGTDGQPGETTANEDSVIVRFTELSPPRR